MATRFPFPCTAFVRASFRALGIVRNKNPAPVADRGHNWKNWITVPKGEPMKSKVTIVLALAVSFTVYSQDAAAGRINRRQGAQHSRIRQGIKSGELTQGEAARTRAEQRRVRRMEAKAKADGQVTGEEQAKISHEQNKASKQIYRLKHNQNSRQE
jgi:hypothetical protein